ncbi:hypothetical protein F443_19893 [Phytophthora nicotianae P1569]|uniref:DNA-directed DNA polymerase n=1 Tax=Phytophthora nicotianae P1569 TaxID=1317065 RepID=V9E3A7_PHYNI|nr:hypothetical protein F443_19893 [Phytophthora nicotianae P1569]
MTCGRLVKEEAYEGIVQDMLDDKIFGVLECDIRTPEHLKDYFSEMTPIFKNILIDCENESIIGSHMYQYNESRGKQCAKPARKLIRSYFGENILIYTYSFVRASAHKAFAAFMNEVSDARRAGDVDESKAMIAEMMKLVGNSAFGRSGMDMTRHKEIKFE